MIENEKIQDTEDASLHPNASSQRGRRMSRSRSHGEESPESVQASPSSWDQSSRGRSLLRKMTDPFSEANLRRRGYHTLQSFDKTFHVEKRWKLIREMGSGAYGVVISAADDISGETVAIKMVTRIFEKTQLAKRALRELALLRHFNNHENITGLIDVDAIASNFNEMYLFMEPMEADLHQIIKSGQMLSNEHVQYFTYQILRGMKYVHSASVVHRDLKPGNLLVNSDCELKICDFGLSRGFESRPDEYVSHMTEYVATRWYRAPEIMLAFKRYDTAIDVWSIGCILAELLTGKPLFKGKDYVDQLNKILDVLGTPSEAVIKRIGSEKAQAYVRTLPIKKKVPFRKLVPSADPQALDLLEKMLSFDPSGRITVAEALEHPWLSGYHDVNDEPECPTKFDRWLDIEKLETIEQFREALWKEIEDYRREVRMIALEMLDDEPAPLRSPSVLSAVDEGGDKAQAEVVDEEMVNATRLEGVDECTREKVEGQGQSEAQQEDTETIPPLAEFPSKETSMEKRRNSGSSTQGSSSLAYPTQRIPAVTRDPLVSYARRTSMFGAHSNRGSLYESATGSPSDPYQPMSTGTHPTPTRASSFIDDGSGANFGGYTLGAGHVKDSSNSTVGGIAFPSMQQRDGFIVPARSRTASMATGYDVPRKLLRTLSTVSIYESLGPAAGGGEGGGEGAASGVAPIAKIIREKRTEADAPPSEMPGDFQIGVGGSDSESESGGGQ